MRIAKFLLPLAVLGLGFGAFKVFDVTREETEPLRPKEQAPVVSTQVVLMTTASPSVRVFGQVEAPDMSMLTAAVAADIVAVNALEGDAVKRGQELVVMDDSDAALEILQRRAELAEIDALRESDKIKLAADQAALAAEEALLALARKAVQRAERLVKSQAGSEATLDQSRQDEQRQLLAVTARRHSVDDFAARQGQLQARHDKAAALLQRAERDRARTRITAPFDGRVTEVMVSPGDRAAAGTQLLQLYNEAQLELRAQVPSVYLPALRRALEAGQPIDAEAIDNAAFDNGGRIALSLHRLSAEVGEGQAGVDAFFRARDGSLSVPGDTVAVTLKLPPIAGVIVLAPQALYGRDRVYEVRDDALHARSVRRLGQLNDADGRQMLIIAGEGFEAGAHILNSRLPQAVSGLKVEVASQ